MAERNEKVYDRVRQELEKGSKAGSRELYEMAQQVDKSIGQDSLQQFHARYVLPVKRAQARANGGGKKRGGRKSKAEGKQSTGSRKAGRPRRTARQKAEKAGSDREHIRAVLLQFAQDFSAAENTSDIVRVMARVDDYVEQITVVLN